MDIFKIADKAQSDVTLATTGKGRIQETDQGKKTITNIKNSQQCENVDLAKI